MLLKRGLSATIKELLMSAEYLVAHGNSNVLLCERGIRTFETTRAIFPRFPYSTPQFRNMMQELKPYINLWKESRAREVAAAV